MARAQVDERDLRREIFEFQHRYPAVEPDALFVLWFLRAFITDSESEAAKSLCGGPKDKGIDAVLVDRDTKLIFVVQGKYRQRSGSKLEHRGDVLGFAQVAEALLGDDERFSSFVKGIAPDVGRKLEEARGHLVKREYGLRLLYATMGRVSSDLESEADRAVRRIQKTCSFEVLDGKRILLLLGDYLDGVAPPVATLDLEIEAGVGRAGVLNRFDPTTEIESWVFSMSELAVSGLYERAGTRLFARNVRGFLGSTEINRGMEATLTREPSYFWYYNNGITIVCDDASLESSRGHDVLRVTNPQVINGQQTTRTLARVQRRGGSRASVIVRVIRVPRLGAEGPNSFDALVSRIVSATNWQNAIRPSDLMSNDRKQIEIERQLRKLEYLYVRKRMTKGEARRAAGSRHLSLIKKEELAQAVAGCELDPSVVRAGKERLFEERWYSQVFPTANPDFYLNRYWLLKAVGHAARGFPERAYAKWLVMNFVWSQLERHVRPRARSETFRRTCGERPVRSVVGPFDRAIEAAFNGTLRFYRARRGRGQTAKDVSSFFQRSKLPVDFQRFWRGRANKSRPGFDKSWRKFVKALDKASAA